MKYTGQPQTCRICAKTGHFAKDCPSNVRKPGGKPTEKPAEEQPVPEQMDNPEPNPTPEQPATVPQNSHQSPKDKYQQTFGSVDSALSDVKDIQSVTSLNEDGFFPPPPPPPHQKTYLEMQLFLQNLVRLRWRRTSKVIVSFTVPVAGLAVL